MRIFGAIVNLEGLVSSSSDGGDNGFLRACEDTPFAFEDVLVDNGIVEVQKWRMRFNPLKTNIICIGKQAHAKPPVWKIGDAEVGLTEDALVLGVTFTSELSSDKHIRNRVRKCQQSMFGMASIGLSYPGLNSEVKAFLWNSIGNPILLYGMEAIATNKSDMEVLKTTQGNIIKRITGINKRSHHSKLLKALSIPPVEDIIIKNTIRLYHNIFKTDTPARDLQATMLSEYLINGRTTKGSLLDRIITGGRNPLKIIFDKQLYVCSTFDTTEPSDGVTDSLRYLVHHNDYNKPWSEEHILATLLTKAF